MVCLFRSMDLVMLITLLGSMDPSRDDIHKGWRERGQIQAAL